MNPNYNIEVLKNDINKTWGDTSAQANELNRILSNLGSLSERDKETREIIYKRNFEIAKLEEEVAGLKEQYSKSKELIVSANEKNLSLLETIENYKLIIDGYERAIDFQKGHVAYIENIKNELTKRIDSFNNSRIGRILKFFKVSI